MGERMSRRGLGPGAWPGQQACGSETTGKVAPMGHLKVAYWSCPFHKHRNSRMLISSEQRPLAACAAASPRLLWADRRPAAATGRVRVRHTLCCL
eukprot:scaffold946_cov115-Isochrysis_galbana.AAC.4